MATTAFQTMTVERRDRPEPPHEIELVLLLPGRLRGMAAAEGERIGRIEGQGHPGVLRAEIERVDRLPGVAPRRPPQHHVARQIVVERAEPVGSPCAETRLRFVEPVPAGVDLVLGSVVVVGRPHVPYETEVVDDTGERGPPIGDLDAAAPPRREAHLEWIDDRIDVADVDLLGRHRAESLPMGGRVDRIVERRLVVGLSRMGIERGLGIEGLEMAVAAGEKNPDHRLGPRPAGRHAEALLTEERLDGQAAEAETEPHAGTGGEEPASRGHPIARWRCSHRRPLQRMATKSL